MTRLGKHSIRCLFGHLWEDHPKFRRFPVRRCTRCGRCEHRTILAGWHRVTHIEDMRTHAD